MIHLTLNQISAYLDNELPMASVELVRLHLSSCLECTERFGLIEEQETALARLLVDDPGDPFFEGFSDRVLGPKPVESAPAAPSPPPPPEPAAVPRVSATPPPAATSSEARTPRPKRRTARFLLPAAALLVVVSAAAMVAVGPEGLRLGSLLPSLGVLPATTPHAADSSPSGDAQSPAEASAPGPDPSSAAVLLERAAERSAAAQRSGAAEDYDVAATAWEAALPELRANEDELAAGRREVASARFAAWRATPDAARRESATAAVRAFLLGAPPGPDRDRAWAWLAELKR